MVDKKFLTDEFIFQLIQLAAQDSKMRLNLRPVVKKLIEMREKEEE